MMVHVQQTLSLLLLHLPPVVWQVLFVLHPFKSWLLSLLLELYSRLLVIERGLEVVSVQVISHLKDILP
jgi:hypothetical protein